MSLFCDVEAVACDVNLEGVCESRRRLMRSDAAYGDVRHLASTRRAYLLAPYGAHLFFIYLEIMPAGK